MWINECFSEGRLRLASPDPTVDPLIDEDMVSDERDRVRMVDGVRRIIELVASGAVQDIAAAPMIDRLGDAMPTTDFTDDELADWADRAASDAQHICGTARMGLGDDAVVDPLCQVRGVDALKVVDASVFPRVPRANTHLMVLATAEVIARSGTW